MTTDQNPPISVQTAESVLHCSDLDATLPFFTDRLGFAITAIFPADAPTVVVLEGHGLRLRLENHPDASPGNLRLYCAELGSPSEELTAPNGTRIQLIRTQTELLLPPLRSSFVLSRMNAASAWQSGRAGMQYRDLIPDRQGGRFIASHIKIPGGGPVPDYVHFHRIHFQMIFCYKGWVRVVYEDQGPPFVLKAGDCVLQPPEIRHRVLESSPGLEVVEIGCPAEHETCGDQHLELPTDRLSPDRDFGGQHFVRHEAALATWKDCDQPGATARDLGMGTATGGLAAARIVRCRADMQAEPSVQPAEFCFRFILSGTGVLRREGQAEETVQPGDAIVIPAGTSNSLTPASQLGTDRSSADGSPDSSSFEFLEVTLPEVAGPG